MVNKGVSDFYDDFTSHQERIGYNARHFLMLDRLLESGLRGDSTVVELGCGIGIITSLILKVLREGAVVAVDISPKSIEIAKGRGDQRRCRFEVGDITEFDPGVRQADFVTLFDVLEHVPVRGHQALFERIEGYIGEQGQLLVNIPNPEYLDYLHEHEPEKLQIIDQPLSIADLVKTAHEAGFVMRQFETYDLWHKNESIFMRFEKQQAFEEIETDPPTQSILRRIQNKFETYW